PVDQLEVERLPGRVDPSVGHLPRRLEAELPILGELLDELSVEAVDDRLEDLPFLVGQRPQWAPHVFAFGRLDRRGREPELLQEPLGASRARAGSGPRGGAGPPMTRLGAPPSSERNPETSSRRILARPCPSTVCSWSGSIRGVRSSEISEQPARSGTSASAGSRRMG